MDLPVNEIICGDNVEVLRTFPDECIDMSCTSPPYDALRKYGGHEWGWDNFTNLAPELYRVTKQGGVVVWVVADATVDGSETGTSFKQALHFKECGFRLHDTMIYEKAQISFPDSVRYYDCWEFMFVFSKGGPSAFNPIKTKNPLAGKPVLGRERSKGDQLSPILNRTRPDESVLRNRWTFTTGSATSPDGKDHPAPFPESLARDHILSWSNPGDIVLDPFAGSFTTCKMAKHNGRRWIGIEINQEYIAIGKTRLAQEVFDFSS